MLILFSNTIAQLIKEKLPKLEPFFGTDDDENTLDLSRVKELKGHRTELVQNCLKIIHQLDILSKDKLFKNNEKKNYILKNTQLLLEELKNYSLNCDSTPRIKDFLNIIPDNTSTIVGFTLVITSLLSTQFPFLIPVPLTLGLWILLDLIFNNRTVAKKLKERVRTINHELKTISATHNILKNEAPIPSETQQLSAAASTNQNYHSLSELNASAHAFFHTADNLPNTEVNLETSFSSLSNH